MAEVVALKRIAIVTGAGSGIGRAIARALLESGVKVVGVDIIGHGLKELELEAREMPGAVFMPVQADVSSYSDCANAVAAATAALGQADILINSAGVGAVYSRPEEFSGLMRFWQADPAKWEKQIAINNNGPYFMARLTVEGMIDRGWGRIINISTGLATMLSTGRGAYGAAKAGLEANTLIWSKDLDGTGVTVNALLPGGTTDTPLKAGIDTGIPKTEPSAPLLSTTIFRHPILWLISEKSDQVSGYRFIAKNWDCSLEPSQAAQLCGSPAAWKTT